MLMELMKFVFETKKINVLIYDGKLFYYGQKCLDYAESLTSIYAKLKMSHLVIRNLFFLQA